MSKKSNGKHLNLENKVIFQGFDSLYEQVLGIEGQLLCPKVQTEAVETFDDLKKSFESFQSKIRAVGLNAKRKQTFKTYTKWRFTTCSTNKSWTLQFLPKNAYLSGMRTYMGAYLSGRLLFIGREFEYSIVS